MTNTTIPDDVKMILSLGPKFAVTQRKNDIPVRNLIADVENVITAIENKDIHNQLRSKTAKIISNHIFRSKPLTRKQLVLYKAYTDTRNFLKTNPNIIITEADKGNVTVAIEKDQYNQLLTQHFINKEKFIRLIKYKQQAT